MLCVMCSPLARSDGMSVGRVLTFVDNLNNDKQQQHHHLLFSCHVALRDVAPRNPLVLSH